MKLMLFSCGNHIKFKNFLDQTNSENNSTPPNPYSLDQVCPDTFAGHML